MGKGMLSAGRNSGLGRKQVATRRTVLIVAMLLGAVTVLPGVAGAGPLVRLTKPQTKILALSAIPISLTAAGGVVNLSGVVRAATSCTFSDIVLPRQGSPATGLPATVPCSNGTVSTTVTVPGNACCTQLNYRFRLSVSGTHTRTAVMVIAVPPASVTDCSNPQPYADLEGCDFSNQDLQGGNYQFADFNSANLTDTNMSVSEISVSNFGSVNATGAQFVHSDLTGAEFYSATLTNTNFAEANLTDAVLPSDLQVLFGGIPPVRTAPTAIATATPAWVTSASEARGRRTRTSSCMTGHVLGATPSKRASVQLGRFGPTGEPPNSSS